MHICKPGFIVQISQADEYAFSTQVTGQFYWILNISFIVLLFAMHVYQKVHVLIVMIFSYRTITQIHVHIVIMTRTSLHLMFLYSSLRITLYNCFIIMNLCLQYVIYLLFISLRFQNRCVNTCEGRFFYELVILFLFSVLFIIKHILNNQLIFQLPVHDINFMTISFWRFMTISVNKQMTICESLLR